MEKDDVVEIVMSFLVAGQAMTGIALCWGGKEVTGAGV